MHIAQQAPHFGGRFEHIQVEHTQKTGVGTGYQASHKTPLSDSMHNPLPNPQSENGRMHIDTFNRLIGVLAKESPLVSFKFQCGPPNTEITIRPEAGKTHADTVEIKTVYDISLRTTALSNRESRQQLSHVDSELEKSLKGLNVSYEIGSPNTVNPFQ